MKYEPEVVPLLIDERLKKNKLGIDQQQWCMREFDVPSRWGGGGCTMLEIKKFNLE